jgi:hypothetical protein
MIRFERRLRQLEAQLTDLSGLVPHTQQWFDYWTERLDRRFAGEELDEKIPLEFFDAVIAGTETVQQMGQRQ